MSAMSLACLLCVAFIVIVGILLALTSPTSTNDHCKTDSILLPDWEKVPYFKNEVSPKISVDIKWSRFPHNYPRGNQDSAGTIWKGMLFSTGGFCGGDYYPYWCKNRGFYTDTYLFNFSNNQWNRIDDMPGAGRQGHKCETVNDEVYCMGGFSYTSPYSHRDAYKYNGVWSRIKDVPTHHTAAAQICSMGDTIYLLDSAYYNGIDFFTSDRLFAYKTTTDVWVQISTFPGTPRWSTDITCINDEIFVLGGASGNHNAYITTVIDNWKYDVTTNVWTRLSDTPLVIGNWMFQTHHKGYIFLIGGAGYMKVKNSTAVIIPKNMNIPHSPISRNIGVDYLYTNNVFVYNISSNEFIHGTPLPYDWNGPTVWLKDDTFYLAAGELGLICTEDEFLSRHPSMILQGKLTE